MGARQSSNLILVHFNSAFPADSLSAAQNEPDQRRDSFDRTQWYCQWACEHGAVYAIAPQCLKPNHNAIQSHLNVPVIHYTDQLYFPSPEILRGVTDVWLINGNDLPLMDWDAAREQARRQNADVLVFGHRSFDTNGRYPETAVVDDNHELLSFRRHYFDSPSFADLFTGQASFMLVRPRFAQGALNHVISLGWGLDGVGALTRSFSVKWASKPCVQSPFESRAGVDFLDPAGSNGNGLSATAKPAGLRIWFHQMFSGNGVDENGDSHLKQADFIRSRLTLPASVDDGAVISLSGRTHLLFDAQANSFAGSFFDNELPAGPGAGYYFTKRTIDIFLAATTLIALSPFLLIIAILVKLTSRGPILFAHKRQGLGGREFRCWKFRSMKQGADKLQRALRELNEVDGPQFKIAADPRITQIGGFLRKTNLDELPQLLNVLWGSMSLVGPRPSPDDENQLCPAWRRARLSVKPGITGLWQVLRLRNNPNVDFQEWIYYDVEYARHRSLWLDVQLLLYTPVAVLVPRRVARFARKLKRHGICPHSRQTLSHEAAKVPA